MLLQQLANSLALGSVYVLVALGLFLVFSTLHIPNFAHGEMFALGAYLQWWLVTEVGIPFVAAMVVVVVVVGALGAAMFLAVFRRLQRTSVMAMFLGSLAVAIILQEVFGLLWGKDPLGMSEPVSGVAEIGGIRIANYRILVIVVTVVAASALGVLVFRSAFGRRLRALAQNAEMARLSGIDVTTVGAATFALGSAVAAMAGGLLAPTTALNPHMGFHLTMVSFVILVVVGSGARMGSVIVAGLVLATLETLTVAYVDSSLRSSVVFGVLVLFLVVRPEGVAVSSNATKVRL